MRNIITKERILKAAAKESAKATKELLLFSFELVTGKLLLKIMFFIMFIATWDLFGIYKAVVFTIGFIIFMTMVVMCIMLFVICFSLPS